MVPDVLGQGEESVELGGHHVRVRHPVALDELEHALGAPLVHEHHGVAHVDGRAREPQHGGVVQRRAHDVDVVVAGVDAEQEQDPGQADGHLVGVRARQRPADALGVARGPRGVVHGVAQAAVVGPVGPLVVAQLRVGGEAGDVTDGQAARGGDLGLIGGVEAGVGEALVADEDLGPGVLQDVGDLGGHQVVVDGHDVPPGLHGGEIDLEHLGAIGQDEGDGGALAQAQLAQSVHDLVGPARAARPP